MDRGSTGRGICNAAALDTGLGTATVPFGLAIGAPEVATTRGGSKGRAAGTGRASPVAAGGVVGFGLELKSAAKIPTMALGVFGC